MQHQNDSPVSTSTCQRFGYPLFSVSLDNHGHYVFGPPQTNVFIWSLGGDSIPRASMPSGRHQAYQSV